MTVYGYVLKKLDKSYGRNIDLYAGDTKAGTLIGKDRFGNKFYENLEEELPRRCTAIASR
jgi:hypothetical protein